MGRRTIEQYKTEQLRWRSTRMKIFRPSLQECVKHYNFPILSSDVGYSYHNDFQVAVLFDGSTMIGCLLPINVYDTQRISHQRDFAYQVSRRVATILWISFPYKPDRYSQTTLCQHSPQ